MPPVKLSVPVYKPTHRHKLRKAQMSTFNQLIHIEGYVPYKAQYPICNLMDTQPRVLLSIHREASKSTIAESFCFRKLVSDEPHLILYLSATDDSVKSHLKAIKMKFEQHTLPSGIPNYYRSLMPKRNDPNFEWGAKSFALANGNRIVGGGTGKAILGIKEGNLRPTIIVIDDPVPKEEGKDEDTISWLRQTISNLGSPMTQIILIGTPRRYSDMVMSIINDPETVYEVHNFPAYDENKKVLIPEFWARKGICCDQVRFVCYGIKDAEERKEKHMRQMYQGLYDNDEFNDLMTAYDTVGEDIFYDVHKCCYVPPKYKCWLYKDDQYEEERIWQHIEQKKREVKAIAWTTEYLCKPADSTTTIFPMDVLKSSADNNWSFRASRMMARKINVAYEKGGILPPRLKCVIGCDLAIGTSSDSDYVVFTVLQVHPELRVLDVFRDNAVSYKNQKDTLLKLNNLYRPEMIYIESNQFQTVFAQEMREEHWSMPVYEFHTGSNKHSLQVGVPSIRDHFEYEEIKIPTACSESEEYAGVLFDELNGLALDKGKVVSHRPHDDTPMSLWIAIQAGKEFYGTILNPQ